mmetsp:Transcript_16777/g.45509  ORF Transcript_16777/g.45509 Transcript_16777/m.45509 type:complete len:150 (-) Transcript_16777:66-515(-)
MNFEAQLAFSVQERLVPLLAAHAEQLIREISKRSYEGCRADPLSTIGLGENGNDERGAAVEDWQDVVGSTLREGGGEVEDAGEKDGKGKRRRACKAKRERYKALVSHLEELIRSDPDMDVSDLTLPNFVTSSEWLSAKLRARLAMSRMR